MITNQECLVIHVLLYERGYQGSSEVLKQEEFEAYVCLCGKGKRRFVLRLIVRTSPQDNVKTKAKC